MDCVRRSITSPYGRSCLRLIAALAGLFLTLSGLQAAPAAAEPEPVPGPVRGSAYMGMGVRAHDTVSDPPDVMAPTAMPPSAMPPSAMAPTAKATQTEGVDVASYQGDVAWATLWSAGVRWAYTKATEGTSYRNPYFAQQYDGPYDVGMIRGAYHFAAPDSSSGTAQADYFVDHGGGWTADGLTLPGVLDIEWNPYGDACYGKSTSAMVTWIRDFLKRYKDRTHRDAVIYTATAWWDSCTGSYSGFGATNPLWVARYASSVGALPAGWKTHTMWQYTSSGATVGDRDKFNGAVDTLRKFATG
ncbi:lysozyme [Streptomyces sp. NBC_00847]|uniref:lysozyme n=1 Tax=Streptomyces sp. NBC_00847 TaxID=2975850 RepID=UPI0022547D11|nr:lysozyme [Streptomyces sp. NBC_00847]MCX4878304.1 lysozyme [Streptomyces sp. NBC_00847]